MTTFPGTTAASTKRTSDSEDNYVSSSSRDDLIRVESLDHYSTASSSLSSEEDRLSAYTIALTEDDLISMNHIVPEDADIRGHLPSDFRPVSMTVAHVGYTGPTPPAIALRLSSTAIQWEPGPQRVVCPLCSKDVLTSTKTKWDRSAWWTLLLLVVISALLPICLVCVCIQCGSGRLFRVEHRCPDCGKVIGACRK